MALDPILAEILACPQDKGPLYYVAHESMLYNPRLRRVYAVADGIPVLLIDEATDVESGVAEALDARIDCGELTPTFTPTVEP